MTDVYLETMIVLGTMHCTDGKWRVVARHGDRIVYSEPRDTEEAAHDAPFHLNDEPPP